MNSLDLILLEIFDLFDDAYCDFALIYWAIKMDTLASLVEQRPPPFDPLQTIGKYE